jgi:hypothetical protein
VGGKFAVRAEAEHSADNWAGCAHVQIISGMSPKGELLSDTIF